MAKYIVRIVTTVEVEVEADNATDAKDYAGSELAAGRWFGVTEKRTARKAG